MPRFEAKKFAERFLMASIGVFAGSASLTTNAAESQNSIKIGLSAPLTGPFADNGKQMLAATQLFLERNGKTIAGRPIELIIRDDSGEPEQAKRIAQQLVVNTKVAILAGYNPTPTALAVARRDRAKSRRSMGSSTSIATERSLYIVRPFSHSPKLHLLAQWAQRMDQAGHDLGVRFAPELTPVGLLCRRIQGEGGDCGIATRTAANR